MAPRRILYIDDDPDFGQLMQWALAQFGHLVTLFSDPDVALRAIDKAPQDWDLVIAARHAAGPRGFDIVKAVRQRRPDLCCALMCGETDGEANMAVAAYGDAPVVRKPVCMQQFAALVPRIAH
jgi:DNA-binding NtrC family response regulator